jgi:drug/metabolite transporter (DMT)-like permease
MSDAPRHQLFSTAVLVTSALLFGLMAIFAKYAALRVPGHQVLFVRSVVGLLACGLVATRRPLRVGNWGGLFLRGLFGSVAVFLYFTAIAHLSVSIATLLNYTAPIFTALWAALFLRERIGLVTLGALLVSLCGVYLLMRADHPTTAFALSPWELVGLGGAIFSGAAIATIREIRRTEGSWEIFSAFCLSCTLVSAVPTWRSWVMPNAADWWALFGVGVVSVAGQVFMTWALRDVQAAVAGVISFLTPVTALVLGRVLFRERMAPIGLVGAALVLASVAVGGRQATRERRRDSRTVPTALSVSSTP